jgi:hypothetical protein
MMVFGVVEPTRFYERAQSWLVPWMPYYIFCLSDLLFTLDVSIGLKCRWFALYISPSRKVFLYVFHHVVTKEPEDSCHHRQTLHRVYLGIGRIPSLAVQGEEGAHLFSMNAVHLMSPSGRWIVVERTNKTLCLFNAEV